MDDHESFEDKFQALVDVIDPQALDSDEETLKIKNLKTFAECRPPAVEPEPIPDPVPTTAWGKFKHSAWVFWNSENTGVLVKSGLAAAGVLGVTYATVHRDHVLTRDSIGQANQTPK